MPFCEKEDWQFVVCECVAFAAAMDSRYLVDSDYLEGEGEGEDEGEGEGERRKGEVPEEGGSP